MMAKINMLTAQLGEVVVVSDDNAFKTLETNPNIKVYKNLYDLFEAINPHEGLLEPVTKFISTNRQGLIELIHEGIESLNPYIDGQDYDRKGIIGGFDYDETYITEIDDIDCHFLSIDMVSKDYVLATVLCKAKITADCNYFDGSDSVWDSESKTYLFISYGQTEEIHIIEFEATLELGFIDEQIIEYHKIQFDFSLDQETRVSQKIIETDWEADARADMMDTLEEYHRH